jgi:hypothetical protein
LIRAIPSETFRGKPPRKSGQNGDNVVITNWAIFCQTFGIFETNILFIFFKLISKVQVIFSAFLWDHNIHPKTSACKTCQKQINKRNHKTFNLWKAGCCHF